MSVGLWIENNATGYKQGQLLWSLGERKQHKNLKLFVLEKAIFFKSEISLVSEVKINFSWIDKIGLGSERHLYIVFKLIKLKIQISKNQIYSIKNNSIQDCQLLLRSLSLIVQNRYTPVQKSIFKNQFQNLQNFDLKSLEIKLLTASSESNRTSKLSKKMGSISFGQSEILDSPRDKMFLCDYQIFEERDIKKELSEEEKKELTEK